MARQRSPLFVLFLTVFIDLVGFGIIIPVLPLYAEHFHASPIAIGWLTGIYSGMQIIFTPILGKLSDRFGRRPVLIVSIAGTAIGFVLMGMATALPLLFVARILAGITGGNISIPQAYIADVTAPEQRSRAMGMIGAAFGLGFTFGPLIGGLMSRISYSAPFYFAAGLAVANAILVYFILPESLSREHRASPHEDAAIAEVFRHGRGWMFGLVVATYFFLIAGFSIMTLSSRSSPKSDSVTTPTRTGISLPYVGILSVIVQGGLIGRLVKMFGEVDPGPCWPPFDGRLPGFAAGEPQPHAPPGRVRRSFVRQRSRESTLEWPGLTNDRSQLAGTRSRSHAIRRKRRASSRAVARWLALDVRFEKAAL